MKNIIYPAIFHKNENGGYWVEFPDLPGCLTEGASLEEALVMAGDALFVWFEGNEDAQTQPSEVSEIKTEGEDFASLVRAEPYESEEAVKYKAIEAVEDGLTERKLNKNQAAIILGVDRSYLTYILTGKRIPSPDMAKRLGLLLGFDWRIFYADNG